MEAVYMFLLLARFASEAGSGGGESQIRPSKEKLFLAEKRGSARSGGKTAAVKVGAEQRVSSATALHVRLIAKIICP